MTFENYYGGSADSSVTPTVTTTVDGKSTEKVLKPDGSEAAISDSAHSDTSQSDSAQ